MPGTPIRRQDAQAAIEAVERRRLQNRIAQKKRRKQLNDNPAGLRLTVLNTQGSDRQNSSKTGSKSWADSFGPNIRRIRFQIKHAKTPC